MAKCRSYQTSLNDKHTISTVPPRKKKVSIRISPVELVDLVDSKGLVVSKVVLETLATCLNLFSEVRLVEVEEHLAVQVEELVGIDPFEGTISRFK